VTKQTVKGFEVRVDRLYDLEHHMWIELLGDDRVRIGMDSLGVETSGTLAHLSAVSMGTVIPRGEPFGSLEAEKYVGPLVAPLSGTIVAVNEEVFADPKKVESDPYDSGWMIEMEPSDLAAERAGLIEGTNVIAERFAQKVTEYRLEGVLAE
jgi:glycine cleavage system H protein